MFEHSLYLLAGDSGEPLKKIIGGGSIGEVLEQRGNRNPAATKNPGPAHPPG
jgi:hypothetical protein